MRTLLALLLLLAGCQLLAPDELHVWGSQTMNDGTGAIAGPGGTRTYATDEDGDAWSLGLGFTWSLAPPKDMDRSIARSLHVLADSIENPYREPGPAPESTKREESAFRPERKPPVEAPGEDLWTEFIGAIALAVMAALSYFTRYYIPWVGGWLRSRNGGDVRDAGNDGKG